MAYQKPVDRHASGKTLWQRWRQAHLHLQRTHIHEANLRAAQRCHANLRGAMLNQARELAARVLST